MLALLLFSSAHSFSIGFRSGEWDGHGISLILCSVTHFSVDFDVCSGSPSWWKIHYKISSTDFLSVGIFANPWYHVSPAKWNRPTTLKIQHLTMGMGYFSVYQFSVFAAKNLFFYFHLILEPGPFWLSKDHSWRIAVISWVLGSESLKGIDTPLFWK